MTDYIIGSPFKASRNHYRRDDVYTPTGNHNSIMVAGLQDLTPIYKHWRPSNLKANCSCCFLGIAHSEAKHKESTNA